MSLELRVHVEGRVGVVAAHGEIDVQTVSLLKQGIDRVAAGGVPVVALDLAEVTFIDSSGLGAVLGRHRMLAANGGRLVLIAPSTQLRRMLTVTGLDGVLQVVDGVADIQP